MKIAITGASGFLGGALAEAYIEKGEAVAALVRQTSDTSRLEQLGASIIYGELTDPDSFLNLAEGADMAIHCAAIASDFGRWEDFQAINVNAVNLFLDACLQQKVARAIYISSVAVYGNGRHHRGSDEDTAYEDIIIDNYTRSKIMAERIAFNFIAEQKSPLTIIRPGYIWGDGDRAVMPKIVDGLKRGLLAVVDHGENLMNLTHVDNLVQGIRLAGQTEKAIGRAYNITDGSKVTTMKFFEDLLAIIGIDYKIRSYPYVPAYVAAYFCELYARLRNYKVTPPITRYSVRMGKYDQVFDISRAMYELGYKPSVTYNAGMTGMVRYIRRLFYGQK